MDTPLQNAIADSLPANDVNADPSTVPAQAEPVAPAEATAPQAEPVKEPPFNEHPRWKEIQEEKRQLAEQNRQLMELLQKQQAPQPQPVQAPDNSTPEEKAFWDKNRQFLRQESEPLIQELRREIHDNKITTMSLIYRDFQQRHPDVVPGSSQEIKIAEYFKKGLDLDTAYEAVFSPIKAQIEIEKVRKSQQVKTQQKIQANMETTSVQSNAIPSAEPKTFRDKLRESFKQAGV